MSKKEKRHESKIKKAKAFLEVIKMNESDKAAGSNNKSLILEPKSSDVDPVTEKPKLSADELKELRAELKRRQKLSMQKGKVFLNPPSFRDYDGTKKTPGYVYKPDQSLFVVDLQHVFLTAAMKELAPWKPRWCQVKRPSRFDRCILFIVDDVSVEDFRAHQAVMPCLSNTFSTRVEMISPTEYGASVPQQLFDVPVSFRKLAGRTKFSVDQESLKPEAVLNHVDSFPRTNLLLNLQQMIEDGFPLPHNGDELPYFVFSQEEYCEVTPASPLFAIDCEMCKTIDNQSELTRVSVVNEKLECIYDTLVKPHNPISNYLTAHSGITEKALANVTTRLQDVQIKLRELLPKDAIIVGQSLNFDLKALKLYHPYVIDTSVIYNMSGNEKTKSSLRNLTKYFLHRDIQTGNSGHSPIEDALAAMELTLLKLKNGVRFGDFISGGVIFPHATTTASNGHNEPAQQSSSSNTDTNNTDSNDAETSEPNPEVMEPHRTWVSLKRKQTSDTSSEEGNIEPPSKRQKVDTPLVERKKAFYVQPGSQKYECFFAQCKQHNKTATVVGREDFVSSMKDRCAVSVCVESDKDAMKKASQLCDKHFFTIVRLSKFSNRFTELMSPQEKQKILQKMDVRFGKFLSTLGEEKCSLVTVLFTGRTTPLSSHRAMTCVHTT